MTAPIIVFAGGQGRLLCGERKTSMDGMHVGWVPVEPGHRDGGTNPDVKGTNFGTTTTIEYVLRVESATQLRKFALRPAPRDTPENAPSSKGNLQEGAV
jgi:hypothetical protein